MQPSPKQALSEHDDIMRSLEAKLDALIAYTHTLERRNTLLEQQLEQSQKRIHVIESQRAKLSEQLMMLAISLES
ncbi:hypothetical protein [Marinagarivorans algicola]|uniref:hypothetical protein n=1 Tax=Marinagarivorans algicola TaxID=1513270 RepID=UPI0006B69AA5|nr:hypothetical protein [Marinagarivorans algicola]